MVASAPKVIVPFADKDPDNWHEGIYDFYELCEIALGLRKEMSPEESAAEQAYADAEEALMAGDPNWTKHLHPSAHESDGIALDEFLGMNNNLDKITESEMSRKPMVAYEMTDFFNLGNIEEEEY